ncbi:MAG: hypothetical protein WA654_13150, partial [Candidatus Sulfotelmatobacter sp.]
GAGRDFFTLVEHEDHDPMRNAKAQPGSAPQWLGVPRSHSADALSCLRKLHAPALAGKETIATQPGLHRIADY